MSTKSKSSQTALVARALRAVAGIQKYLASMPSLVMASVTYTPAQLASLFQAYVTAVTALKLLHVQLHTAVKGERAQAAQIVELLTQLETFAVNLYGATADQVTEFGFTPKKEAALTTAEKAASNAKASATRKAKKNALASVTASSTPAVAPAPSNGTTVKV